jgi:hypothetical protein
MSSSYDIEASAIIKGCNTIVISKNVSGQITPTVEEMYCCGVYKRRIVGRLV